MQLAQQSATTRAVAARGVQVRRAALRAPVLLQQRRTRVLSRAYYDDDEQAERGPINEWPNPEFVASVLEAFPDQGLGECFVWVFVVVGVGVVCRRRRRR